MKKFFPTFLMALFSIAASSQNSKPYKFPVVPGTAQWTAFKTHDEMLQACQLPADYLKNSSTAALAQTCLDYPLFNDFLAYNSFQQGVDAVVAKFNGFQELLQRKDNAPALLAVYRKMALGDAKINQAGLSLKLIGVECLLVKEAVIKNNTPAELTILAEEAYKKLQDREKVKDIAGPVNKISTAYLLGNTMKRMNARSFDATGDPINNALKADSREMPEKTADAIINTYQRVRKGQ
jgi:hypothetical protein